MRKSYSLSRLVLGTGAAEKIKNPLMILGVDAPAVVRYLEDRKTELGAAPDSDVTGNSGL